MTDTDEDIFSMDDDLSPGLGRGLNALFEDEEPSEIIAAVEKKVQDEENAGTVRPRHMVGIDQLSPSMFQPRILFKDESLNALAESIKEYGILQPLLVRKNPHDPNQYEIIAGERRWRAAQKAGLHELPVVELELNEVEAFKIALIENLQREDLDPIDEAMGYKKLLDEYGQTQDDLARAVGKSRPHITNMVRLLNLPVEVQGYISVGDLTMGHARALITCEDPASLAKQVIAKGLSVRQTEKFAADKKGVEQKKQSKPAATKSVRAEKDPDTIALENDMSNALGMRVNIDSPDGKSGKLNIEFKSLDQLDEILHRLAHYPGSRLNG